MNKCMHTITDICNVAGVKNVFEYSNSVKNSCYTLRIKDVSKYIPLFSSTMSLSEMKDWF